MQALTKLRRHSRHTQSSLQQSNPEWENDYPAKPDPLRKTSLLRCLSAWSQLVEIRTSSFFDFNSAFEDGFGHLNHVRRWCLISGGFYYAPKNVDVRIVLRTVDYVSQLLEFGWE